ncbi:hypothetical protein F66182_5531 [Fusarium sp. NRRL 66182]|nr:hypothetical protein F66182_5531 [Fusarium sp. NRRL 66182]
MAKIIVDLTAGTGNGDESISFYFPDHHSALISFNNDLTDSGLPSDDGWITDDTDSDVSEETTVPSSYLGSLHVKPTSCLSPISNTASATMSASQRSSTPELDAYKSDSTTQELSDSPKTQASNEGAPETLRVQRSSVSTDRPRDNDDVSKVVHPGRINQTPIRESSSSSSTASATAMQNIRHIDRDPYLPSYIVQHFNPKYPLETHALGKHDNQRDREIDALTWDTLRLFESSHETGTAGYKADLLEWRKRRRRCIGMSEKRERAHSD